MRQFQFFPARLSFRGERALAEMRGLQAAEDALYHRCQEQAQPPKAVKKRKVATKATRQSARNKSNAQRDAAAAKEERRVQEDKVKAEEEKQERDFLWNRAVTAQDILDRGREWPVLCWPPPFLS